MIIENITSSQLNNKSIIFEIENSILNFDNISLRNLLINDL